MIPRLGRSPGEVKGYQFQYSGLENSMDCVVHGVAQTQTRLSNFHFTYMLLYIKQITSKELLYSPGRNTQYLVITCKGEDSEKTRYICMYS